MSAKPNSATLSEPEQITGNHCTLERAANIPTDIDASSREPGRSVLMIAFHYPPCRGSSGIQRTLSFSRYLAEYGWSPIILSASPHAYANQGPDQLRDIPDSVPVHRAFALDTARHLSLRGRYISWTSLPDRWVSWCLDAVPAGLRLIRRYRPDVIWSTYPIATAHLIALALHRFSGIPWVADFRDPMTEVDPVTGQNHPPDPRLWRVRRFIESRTVRACTRAVLVTQSSRRLHADRYTDLPDSHWAVVSNGFDEQAFTGAANLRPSNALNRPLVLLHSGVLYPTPDRDPTAFFTALAKLRFSGQISSASLRVVLRASGHDDRYRQQVRDLGIDDLVSLEPPISYRDALAEMLAADGLLVFQGYTSNPAIPAKLYEYLRAQRPILAMVDSEGDTAATLRKSAVGRVVPLESVEQIEAGLLAFLDGIRCNREPIASDSEIARHSRKAKSAELAAVLDSVVAAPASSKRTAA
jgi:glycosyltransferase involved in cell wall biosynthesis